MLQELQNHCKVLRSHEVQKYTQPVVVRIDAPDLDVDLTRDVEAKSDQIQAVAAAVALNRIDVVAGLKVAGFASLAVFAFAAAVDYAVADWTDLCVVVSLIAVTVAVAVVLVVLVVVLVVVVVAAGQVVSALTIGHEHHLAFFVVAFLFVVTFAVVFFVFVSQLLLPQQTLYLSLVASSLPSPPSFAETPLLKFLVQPFQQQLQLLLLPLADAQALQL